MADRDGHVAGHGLAMTADEIIRTLALLPHPEGGHYRETFRDETSAGVRAASTAIYYLLRRGELSRWHRVDAAEVWHWYAGAPLALMTSPDGHSATRHILGPDLRSGARPQYVVRSGVWQSASSLGDYTLVGCTVAPGFTFDGFEMADADFLPQPTG